MSKLGRRQTIKLGTAAALVGPSVLFSRTASAKPPSFGDAIGAYNFKVEIEGVTQGLTAVRSVDLGNVKWDSGGTPSFGYVKVSLDSEVRELSLKFDKGAKVAAHKVSVSLYGKGGKKPTVTYHALDAVPSGAVEVGGKQQLSWKIGSMAVEAYKLDAASRGKHARLPRGLVKLDVGGFKMAAADTLKFSVDNKASDVKVSAYEGWPSKWKGSDQVALKTFAVPGAPPASAIFVKTLTTKAAGDFTKWDPGIQEIQEPKRASVHKRAAVPLDKSTPILMLELGRPTAAASKSKPPILVLSSAGGKHLTSDESRSLKLSLRGIDFPKLERGSKALVTETLYFDIVPDDE